MSDRTQSIKEKNRECARRWIARGRGARVWELLLPTDPAARISMVHHASKAGLITPRTARRLLA